MEYENFRKFIGEFDGKKQKSVKIALKDVSGISDDHWDSEHKGNREFLL